MKWAIREAVDVYFKAKSAFKLGARTFRIGEPVLIFDTVKTSTLEATSEVSYVTGGRGNSRILSYEGDKNLTFSFEEALLSAEGLAILAGADLIPARNSKLPGAAPEARSVISHYTEKYSVVANNRIDEYEGLTRNVYPDDPALGSGTNLKPRGGADNVWLTRKPYVGQNGSIYVMLLDNAGEISGAPIEVNLRTSDVFTFRAKEEEETEEAYKEAKAKAEARHASMTYLRKFSAGDKFVAFDKAGLPIAKASATVDPLGKDAAIFDDGVAYYVDLASAQANWVSGWGTTPVDGDIWTRQIPADATYESDWYLDRAVGAAAHKAYAYLLQPSGGIAQPKCFKEGSQFVYKVNVPSILYQDMVLLDYYVEYRHNATQVSILPDKFAPFMYVEGSSLLRRASDGMDLPVEFVIPKLKITTGISFTLTSSGDASTFAFNGDAYPDFSKFDLSRKVLADIQILDADDNYDGAAGETAADPTSYRRYKYNDDTDGDYLWKDPAIADHANLDYSDAHYEPEKGGPASVNEDSEGNGLIYHD